MNEKKNAVQPPMAEVVRFFFVSVFGVLIDLSIAYSLVAMFGILTWVAAAVGFLTGAIVNYFCHELWTFTNREKMPSGSRAVKYIATSALTLAVRIGVAVGLEIILKYENMLCILLFAAGVSFFFNFIVSKFFVFSNAKQKGHI
jgi:putative flippase GtrA